MNAAQGMFVVHAMDIAHGMYVVHGTCSTTMYGMRCTYCITALSSAVLQLCVSKGLEGYLHSLMVHVRD